MGFHRWPGEGNPTGSPGPVETWSKLPNSEKVTALELDADDLQGMGGILRKDEENEVGQVIALKGVL